MKKLILLLCIIALSGVVATPGFAEITPGRVSLSPFIGWYSFDSDVQLKDKPVYGLRLGYDITERWGAEGVFDSVPTKLTNGSGDTTVSGLRFDALYHFLSKEKLVPYLAAGVGLTMADYPRSYPANGNDYLFNYGAGAKYFLSEKWALRADIRNLLVFDGGRSDWESTLGLTYLFGGKKPVAVAAAVKDSDNDGITDSLDKCPNTPQGAKVDTKGCPLDSDGDGVPDYLDRCPNTLQGVKVDTNGCPIDKDSDGDGVPDSLDKCPNTPQGVKVDKNGCPLDSDGDGIADYLDKCPNTPQGVKVDTNGCPLDSDGDGVADYLDKCPNTPQGVKVDKDGCPLQKKVSIALMIEFDTGKADIKSKYDDELKKVADFMKTYPDTTTEIQGHTDNVGKEASNVKLSQRRADSVKAYLVKTFGVSAARLTTKGYGSSQPIADNATPEGRQKNRRINAEIDTTTNQ